MEVVQHGQRLAGRRFKKANGVLAQLVGVKERADLFENLVEDLNDLARLPQHYADAAGVPGAPGDGGPEDEARRCRGEAGGVQVRRADGRENVLDDVDAVLHQRAAAGLALHVHADGLAERPVIAEGEGAVGEVAGGKVDVVPGFDLLHGLHHVGSRGDGVAGVRVDIDEVLLIPPAVGRGNAVGEVVGFGNACAVVAHGRSFLIFEEVAPDGGGIEPPGVRRHGARLGLVEGLLDPDLAELLDRVTADLELLQARIDERGRRAEDGPIDDGDGLAGGFLLDVRVSGAREKGEGQLALEP